LGSTSATSPTSTLFFDLPRAFPSAKSKKAKLILLASNCPQGIRENIEYYCGLSEIPVSLFKGDSSDLGALCGKPFNVSVLAIKEPGDSNILKIAEE